MKISICMCTYNGEKYIEEQLSSILLQIEKADEIIICDDGSTDNTVCILERFKRDFPLTKFKIYRNNHTLGPTKNFEKCISLASGNIILLSDQDDIWNPSKIEMIKNVFNKQQDCSMVFSNGIIMDQNGRNTRKKMWDVVGFKIGDPIHISLFSRNVVTGATMAFRSEYRDMILPIPKDWIHDHWISMVLSSISDIYAINQTLIKYRRHREQSIGMREPTITENIDAALKNKNDYYEIEIAKLKELGERINDPMISDKIEHLRVRNEMKSRITTPITELLTGRYHKYSLGWKSFIKDVLIG